MSKFEVHLDVNWSLLHRGWFAATLSSCILDALREYARSSKKNHMLLLVARITCK